MLLNRASPALSFPGSPWIVATPLWNCATWTKYWNKSQQKVRREYTY